ncbi:Hypp7689 [Branchiostoma lanceolatum]|uniref:Hypp7689 protein n=1 Tax=Branchiostoma lanceolatum TaxID=7740 RepID=A0A8J9Z247_BRALA|nr:Hypp7689 [Branchiostoma lanceolatum]
MTHRPYTSSWTDPSNSTDPNYRANRAEGRMAYVKDMASKAKDFLTAPFTGGNQDNGDPDGMDVDPPNDHQGHFDSHNHGGQRHNEFSGSGGGYPQRPTNQYFQDRRGAGGQQGYHGSNYPPTYQPQRHQTGYPNGHRNNAAFHEQSGGAYDSRSTYSQEQEQLRAMQMREQRHRSLQASKQMVYDVYATTIGMLEEFEDFDDPAGPEGSSEQEGGNRARKSRETMDQGPDRMDPWQGADQHSQGHGRPGTKGTGGRGAKQEKEQHAKGKGKKKRDLGRSDVNIPDQSQKTKRDVKAIVEAELVCLQAQLRFCPPEIRDQTRQELVDKTLGWVAAREAKGLKKGLADAYASQVVEILVTGGTKLQVPTQREESTGPAGEEAVMGGVQALQRGQHYGAEQDKQFHDDPNKKAQCPQIRSGPVPEIHGAQRLVDVNPHLREHFESDLR